MEHRRDIDPTIKQLDRLKQGNLPSNFDQNGKVHFDQMNGQKRKKKILCDSLSYNTQTEILENFIQSLSGPTSNSSNYTSVPSEIEEEQNSSFEDQNQNVGPNEQVESNTTSQEANESHSALSNPNDSHTAVSSSSQIIAEVCTSSD